MGFFKNFVKTFVCAAVFPAVAFGAQTTVGRASVTRTMNSNPDSVSSASIRRSATSVIARNAAQNGHRSRTVSARPTVSRTATSNRTTSTRSVAESAENATVSRTASSKNATVGRSAKSNSVVRTASKNNANVSRAAKSRATAVFSDVSKIGGGYAACRDSYATCMDQFCATANDTYRRCYCSDRFVNFRKTSDSLDQALTMLADFQNNNLDVVDKTAAEVNAMYTASEGEAAVKRDTSASQKLLDNISELLSGKKSYKSTSSVSATPVSTGVLDVSGMFSFADSDDAFSGDGTNVFNTGSLFGSTTSANLSDIEGTDLYNAAHRQCYAIAKNECGGDAAFNLARSAYSIMITQDCNIYEKSINAKKESVQNTIRTAEKYLREARLEEYRAHNSADVNACLNRVESAMRQPTACGENYEKCLDYTGMYINQITGEPIYSKALFDLNNLIKLTSSGDVLAANKNFDEFLETRKMFVTAALDTCRGIADTVWTEYKRAALIQIAQAQDVKIQSVKDSCIETIAECYNKQTGDLEVLGGESLAKRTGAISAIAAHDMCRDSVLACAALYGDVNGCIYDDATKKITQNPNSGGGKCGLDSLLEYVNIADSVRVAQGCETSLREYAKELCDDDDKNGYPWGCRLRSEEDIRKALLSRVDDFCGGNLMTSGTGSNVLSVPRDEAAAAQTSSGMAAAAAIRKHVISRAGTTSGHNVTDLNFNIISNIAQSDDIIENVIRDIRSNLVRQLARECDTITDEGMLLWAASDYGVEKNDVVLIPSTWLKSVYGTDSDLSFLKKTGFSGHKARVDKNGVTLNESGDGSFGWGICMKPTDRQLCELQAGDNNLAEYKNGKCKFKDAWYEDKCTELGGGWYNSTCYLK